MPEPAACTNATPTYLLGRVLRPDEFVARTTYRAAAPDPRLRDRIKRYWSVQWRLDEGESFPAATVSEPRVNLTLERGDILRDGQTGSGVWLTGPVVRGRFDVTLLGAGSVVGVAFHLGGSVGFVDADLVALRDRTVRASAYLPDIERDWNAFPEDALGAADRLDTWLLSRLPDPDAGHAQFRRAIETLADPAVARLDDLAARLECDSRTVQRLFRRYAGVGPKTLITRARVIDAVAALDQGWTGSMADLAQRFGWFDQAHFTRDFRRVTGETPGAYASRRARDG